MIDIKLFEGHTPGIWKWAGDSEIHSLRLESRAKGLMCVMDFQRWGMQNAVPCFATKGLMDKASDWLQFQVGDRSIVGHEAALKDISVYRYDIRGIDHPDARLIESAPELLAELIETRAQRDQARNAVAQMFTAIDLEGEAGIEAVHKIARAEIESWSGVTS